MIVQPAGHRELQRGHKLAKGIIFAFAPGFGGTLAYNLAKKQHGMVNAGTPSLGMTRLGWAATTDGTGDSFAFAGYPTTFSELSVLWVGVVTANASGFNEIAFHTSTNGNNGWYVSLYRTASGGIVSMVKGAVVEAQSNIATSFGVRYALCATGGTTADFAQVNLDTGGLLTHTGVDLTGTPVAGGGTFSLGHYGDAASLPGFGLEGSTNLCIVWDRKLSIAEMIEAVRAPFALVTPKKRRIAVKAAAAGAANAVPQCWAQYRRRRAG